jgi:hypothetical protein
MCGPTKRRNAESFSPNKNNSKHAKKFDWKDVFEQALGYVDSVTLVNASRSCSSLRNSADRNAKSLVLGLIEYFVGNGDVEFTEGIAYKVNALNW